VSLLFQAYILMVVARVLITWFGPDPYHPVVRLLCRATDPLLERLRRWLPLQIGGVDLTPVALLLALYAAKDLLLNLIAQLARG